MVEDTSRGPVSSSPPNERECSRSGDGLILSQESTGRHERGFKTFPWAAADSGNLVEPPQKNLGIASEEEEDEDGAFKPPLSVIVIQKAPPAPEAASSAAHRHHPSVSYEDSSFLASSSSRAGGPVEPCPFLLSPSSGAVAGGAAGDGSSSPYIVSSSLPSFAITSSSSTAASSSGTRTNPATPAQATRPRAASLSSSGASAGASPFRLQPRNPPKLVHLPPGVSSTTHAYGSPPRSYKGIPNNPTGGGATSASMMSVFMSGSSSHRGRKRRAHSMSAYPDPTLVGSSSASVQATTSTAFHGKSSVPAARGGGGATKVALTTPPLFTCTKASVGGYGVLGGGTGTADHSIATETTVRESLLGTPLHDSNSPSSSTATPATATPVSTPGRVLGLSSLQWHSSGHLKTSTPSDSYGADASSSSPGATGVHGMNFQGLSLLSPLRSGAANPTALGGDASLDGSAAASPASSLHGSQASQARSCFSKYQHRHLHQGGVGGVTPAAEDDAQRVRGASTAATAHSNHPNVLSPLSSTPHSMAGGSPKIAPLIVLGGAKSWYSGSTSSVVAPAPSNVAAQLESAAALMDVTTREAAGMKKASRAGGSPRHSGISTPDDKNHKKKRPPLHQNHGSSPYATAVAAPSAPPSVNWMQSLDGSAVADDDPMSPTIFLPPSTVLCHPSTPGSTLSQDAQPRFLKAVKAPDAPLKKCPETLQDDQVPVVAAEAFATPRRGIGSARPRRSLDESPGKRSVMSMSPTSTPLPRLTLTPRSTTSSHAARQLFLSLPTPSDLVVGSGSVDVGASADAPPASSALPSPRRNSYIPLPDWASAGHYETSMSSTEPSFLFEGQIQRQSSHPPALTAAQLSTSLLSPPSPNDAIERFLKDSSFGAGANHQGVSEAFNARAADHDNDSLSASDDDDETFFLATPLAIQEEKQSSLQQSKQRKLRDQSHTSSRSHNSFASSNIMQASSTSLRGMNFVTSSTSLDKIGSKPSSGALCLPQAFSSLKRQDSQTSIGLTLEGTNAPSSEDSAAKDAAALGGRTSSSFSHSATTAATPTGFARDLVTPPVMAQPKSPPPLPSPRIPTATTAAAGLPRSLPNHRSQGRDDLMELDGSNWTPTASSQQRWPCSGEAESPMYTTRVYYTSTAPDGSPSD